MKALSTFLLFICPLGSANLFGALPPGPLAELNSLKVNKLVRKVDDMDPALRKSLASIFHQKVLQLGNPGDPIRGSVTFTNDPERFAPYRRLILSFETPHYSFVYYEKGDPENSAACLIFDLANRRRPRLIWGGVDLQDGVARNPRELRTRIVKGKVWDDQPYIW